MSETKTLHSQEKRLRLHLREIILKWMYFTTHTVGKMGVNQLVKNIHVNISEKMLNDIQQDPYWPFLIVEDYNIVFKYNHYTLCIIVNGKRKYKCTSFLNSKLAKENFKIARNIYKNNPVLKSTRVCNGDDYFIECSDIIKGITLASAFSNTVSQWPIDSAEVNTNITSWPKVLKLVENYTRNNISIVDKTVTHPYDSQTFNFIIPFGQSELICVDFDHINQVPTEIFLEDFSNSFIKHLYDFSGSRNNRKNFAKWWLDFAESNSPEIAKNNVKESLINGLQ